MANVRDKRIDALKCVAIVFVIIGHALVFNALHAAPGGGRVAIGQQWIDRSTLNSVWLNVAYSFHMPLFAFLSAYVLFGREGSSASLIGKRVVGLLVPYFAWALVSYLTSAPRSIADALAYLGHRALYPQSPGAAWFLYALFGCFAVFAAVRSLGGRDRALVVTAVLAAGVIVLPIPGGDIFGVFDVAWLYPFFVMGYLFAKHAEKIARHSTAFLWGGALLWAALLPLLWPVLVPEVNWWYPSLREILHARGIPGAVVVLYGVRYACAAAAAASLFAAYGYLRGRALDWQAWIGRRTLGMYLIQPFVLAFVSASVTRNWVVLAVTAFAGSLAATWVLERSRYTRLVFLGQRTRPASDKG